MYNRTAGIAAILTLLMGTRPITAQGIVREERPTTGKGFFVIGWQSLDLGELNDRMTSNDLPSFSENLLSVGGVAG